MKIILRDYHTLEQVASGSVEQGQFGYEFVGITPMIATLYDEFEQALYGVNNGTTTGVISDGCVNNVPINPYLRFELV